MAEPFKLQKALDLTPTALVKSTSVVLKGVLVIVVIGLFFLGLWIVIKPHFTKPDPTTDIAGDVGTLVQDCSKQVCTAIADCEARNKKAQPWIRLRLWKIAELNLGGT